jgi:hypothetical protein
MVEGYVQTHTRIDTEVEAREVNVPGWIKPPKGMLKLNWDAALDGKTR